MKIASRHRAPGRGLFRQSCAPFLRGRPTPVNWRLDVRADSNDRGMFVGGLAGWRGSSGNRLITYISAGGIRDLRPSRQADRDERHRRFVVAFGWTLLVLWLLFLFVPCHP